MIDFVFLGLVIFAAVYWLAAFASVVLYRRRRPCTSDVAPSVTMLKPLRGDDGQLYENLRSFCLQDYRSFEIVFGVRHFHDPAVAVVERLRHEFPGLELKLVADSRTIGTNLKVSNLANLVRHAKYDTLIVADSDMRVGPGYVRAVVGPLEDRRVGLVTCLYRGVAPYGVAYRLGAMFINEWFLPAALVGTHVERLRHAFGATNACRRDTLRSIGGFEAVADQLADDYMLGWLVSGRSLRAVGRLVLYRSLGQPPPWSDTWLVPLRDVVSFVVGILSFLGRTVRWDDEQFRVRRDGRLERRVETGNRQRLA